MILGAAAISTASASDSEQYSWTQAMMRECDRYGLDFDRVSSAHRGEDPVQTDVGGRKWWDWIIVAIAFGVFVWLGSMAKVPLIAMNTLWSAILILGTLVLLVVAGFVLWKRTRFS